MSTLNGATLFDAVAVSASPATVYSVRFSTSDCSVWSAHIYVSAISTFSAAVTLWASNAIDPDVNTDTDWVEMVAAHGYDGLPGGDPSTASAFKDIVDVGVSGSLWYKFKVVRSAGSATLEGRLNRKGQGR